VAIPVRDAMRYTNRTQAGDVLAQTLLRYRDDASVLVLALPRGGVPVAFRVAHALHAPLDVFIVRKLGLPGHEEFAMGAIASGGVTVMNPDLPQVHLPEAAIEQVVARERAELDRRERLYRDDRAPPTIEDRTVILVDDGLATGSTMLAAATAVRKLQPKSIVVAVPVAVRETCQTLRQVVDEVICARTPEPFVAVGAWYDDFGQTSDAEVHALLDAARQSAERGAA
jgi:putative phosphoribosyl transferase